MLGQDRNPCIYQQIMLETYNASESALEAALLTPSQFMYSASHVTLTNLQNPPIAKGVVAELYVVYEVLELVDLERHKEWRQSR